MTDRDTTALRLIDSGGKGMTERANVLVSAAAPRLLSMGLIEYSSRFVGYRLTRAGRQALCAQLPPLS